MNKLFRRIATLSVGLAMAIGVGVAVGSNEVARVDAASPASITISDLEWGSSGPNAKGEANKVAIDSNVAFYFSGGNDVGKYYTTSPAGARMYYSGSDSITVKATTTGVKLTSVTFKWALKNGGCLHSSKTTGVTSPKYPSNTAVSLSSVDSVTAYVANTGSATNGQVAIQTITVAYTVPEVKYTVTINVNDSSRGEVSQSSVTNVTANTSISSSGATLSVGATNVTASPKASTDQYDYAFSNWSGIPAGGKVTENITVTANFTATTRTYDVTNSVSNASFNGASTVTYGTAYSGTFTANSGYILPASLTSVTIKGTATNNYSYNSTTGEFSIAAQYVTGAIVITGACEETGGDPVGITYSLSNCTIPWKPSQMYPSQQIELTIVPDDHYKLPTEEQNKVSITGASDWVYDDETGSIMIDGAEDDLTVTVECVAKAQNTISMGTLTGVSQADGNPTSVEEGATVTLTFTANEGYGLPTSSGVTVTGTGSSSTWTQGTGKLQITGGTGNITVSITGIARSVTSISLSSNSGSYTLGDTFTMPTVTANYNVGASEDVTASAKATGGGLVDGVLTETGTKTITISYGGYSKTYTATVTAIEPSDAKYVKVTSTAGIVSGGKYLIVNEDATAAFNGTTDADINKVVYTYTASGSDIAASDALTACEVTITYDSVNSRYSLLNSNGKYIGRTSSSNGLEFKDDAIYNTISFSNNNVSIRGLNGTTSTFYLMYNKASGTERFRYYNNNQETVQLYKYQSAVVRTLKWITAEVKPGTYYQGSSVTSSDFTVTAHYDDGKTSTPTTDITVTNGELVNIGANEVTLTYGGKSCKVSVTAIEQTATLTGLSWTQGEYTIIDGQNIDFSKFGTVTAEYDDGEAYATKAISSCTVATYTKSGDVYTKVADISDGATITSSSHGKYLGVTYTETNTFTAYSSAPIYVVESIEDVFVQEKTYTWTKVSSIAVGDTVLLTGTKADDTEPHELSGVTSNSGTIASFSTNPAGTYRLRVVAGASSGSFAFKDADDNYLYHSGTDKTLSLSDELTDASSWTVEFDSETPTKATVTNVDSGNPLQYNPGNYFRVYASASQQPIQFYKGESSLTPTGDSFANTNAAVQKAVLQFAEHFNDIMDCVNSGTTANVASKWSTLSSDFSTAMSGFTGEEDLAHFKALFANAYSVEGGDTLQDMLARYDYIVAKYKLSDDFLHDDTGRGAVAYSARVTPFNIIGNNGNTVAIIVVISMISIAAMGGYFFIRNRKED